MGKSIDPKVSASRYRQLKLTVTQEGLGSFSFRLHGKGLNHAWDERTLLTQGRINAAPMSINTTEEAVNLTIDLLRALRLPGVD